MAKQVSFSYKDRSGESSSVTIHTASVLALSPTLAPTVDAFLNDALGFLSVGDNQYITASETRPMSQSAYGVGNREDKWLVRCQDAVTGEIVTFTVPCRNNALTLVANDDILDPTNVGYAEFVTATEAIVKSKAGNPVIVVDVRLVGRNL